MGIKERIYEIIHRECNGSNAVFAERIDINVSTIQKWDDSHMPKGDILQRIHKEFNIDVTWLLTGEGDPVYEKKQGMRMHLEAITKEEAERRRRIVTEDDQQIKIIKNNKLIGNLTEDELAFVRTMRFCGEDYKHRVYIAATVRAQRMMEEKRLDTKEKLTAQKDLETLSLKAIE